MSVNEGALSREELVENQARNQPRVPARIGQLSFKYTDPAVNVTTEQRTVEHETIDGQVVTQTLGRKADQISIEGVVADYELEYIDSLVSEGVIEVRTDRWSGTVVVQSTNTTFKRAKASDFSWLYDATIECLEVDELPPQEELIQSFGVGSNQFEDIDTTDDTTGLDEE